MYVIVGLGNPGKKYENTRHNLGFITLDCVAEQMGIDINRSKFQAITGEGRINGEKVILVKPQTYMNLSGNSIREVMNFYKVEPENLIVIYDDLDIPAGSVRIRPSGSAGTHNGMRSIVQQLGFDNFPRIRIGIGGAAKKGDMINFVIGGFSKEEVPILEEAVENSAKAALCIVKDGVDRAMNRYNRKPPKKKKESNEGEK